MKHNGSFPYIRLSLPCLLIALAMPAWAQTDYGLRTSLAGLSEGDRDLGTKDGGNRNEFYVDARPWLHQQFNPDWSAYVYLEGFLPSGEVYLDSNEAAASSSASNGFVMAREFWLDYAGLTSYPGESLRLGRQRIQEADGMWWDQDAEALRWIFDTTLVDAFVGVAERFDTYRSDDARLTPEQKHRAYVFGSISGEWMPGQHIGLRTVYADDYGDKPAPGTITDANTKLEYGRLWWIGVHAENGYFDTKNRPTLAYWIEATQEFGKVDTVQLDSSGMTTAQTKSQDVNAWAADAGLRWRLPVSWPLQLGIAYSQAQGGEDNGDSTVFTQNGLQSNRSRFTGTRTAFHRFNEALRADFSNLRSGAVFISVPAEHWDASLVYQKLERDDVDSAVSLLGSDIQPSTRSHDLGEGLDLILTRYLDGSIIPGNWLVDNDSYLRLRASVFRPGEAFAPADKDLHRVVLEWVARF